MTNAKIYINPIEFQKALSREGLFKWVDGKDILIPPFDVEPIDGYEELDNFPKCCDFHKMAFDNAKAYLDKFPFCCEVHKRLADRHELTNPEFQNLAEKVLLKLSYTEFLIRNRINNLDWFEDITEYIEYCVDSFGHPNIGGGHYLQYVHHWINNVSEINVKAAKIQKLNSYFDRYKTSIPKAEPIDFNLLHETYSRWLKSFPFELRLFEDLKSKFTTSIPLLSAPPVYNRYLGTAKAKIITQTELVEYLVEITNNLLLSVSELKNEQVSNDRKLQLQLINSRHKIRQQSLLLQFTKAERKYLKTIKKWLSNELIYAKELKSYVSDLENENVTDVDFTNLSLNEITKSENKFRKLLPMNVVVNHFSAFMNRNSKNGKPFLTEKQLCIFLQKGFLKITGLPKLKINLANGEKAFVIKRFYELFNISVSQYSDVNKKFDYITLITDCFDNWNTKTIEPLFKPNKTKENW